MTIQIEIPECPKCGGPMRLDGRPKGRQRYCCKVCLHPTLVPNFRTVTVDNLEEKVISLLELKHMLKKAKKGKTIDCLLEYVHDPEVTKIVKERLDKWS